MGDSKSWAADMEDEITICKHGNKSKYFDMCMCDGCVSDRNMERYLSGMRDKLIKNFDSWIKTLSKEQLEEMVKKL